MIYYIILINIITFALWGVDKFKAINGQWRIPEKTLMLLIMAGGGVGALLGMTIFHHKIRKPLFWGLSFASIILHGWLLTSVF